MQSVRFFQTQVQPTEETNLLKRKQQLGTYVSKLDLHINKALNFQHRTLNTKKHNFIQTLQKIKNQIYKQSQKTRKMQQFFYLNCQSILKENIQKCGNNQQFFKNVFQLYQNKIRQVKDQVILKKLEVQRKSKQLKQMRRNLKKKYTIQQFSQELRNRKKHNSLNKNKEQSVQKQAAITRVKTQRSLPTLSRPKKINTLASSQDIQLKNYIKPIRTLKTIQNSNTKQSLSQLLNWYRSHKAQYNWFQKVIFIDRNYKKIISSIFSQSN